MWVGFDPTPYTREEYVNHVMSIPAERFGWVKAIRMHNTGLPTLKMWMEYPEVQRLINMQHDYEHNLGWHGGPHGFNGPVHLCGFSDLTRPGVQCSCGNHEELGFEHTGDFRPGGDIWDSGPGAAVRDNGVFGMGLWMWRLGLPPEGLRMHRECAHDHHACPGASVDKADMISRLKAQVAAFKANPPKGATGVTPAARPPVLPPPKLPVEPTGHGVSWVQVSLNRLGAQPRLAPDGAFGTKTFRAVAAFQRKVGIHPVDGRITPTTTAAIARALAAHVDRAAA